MRTIEIPLDVAMRASWALDSVLKQDEQDLTDLEHFASLAQNPEDFIEEIKGRKIDIEQNEKSYKIIRAAIEGKEVSEDYKARFLQVRDYG